METGWQDPFEGHMTDDNIEFIRTHGRWRLVDMSGRPRYRDFVGTQLASVLPLTNRFGNLIGVQLQANGTVMNAFVHADDVHVSWGHEDVLRRTSPPWPPVSRDGRGGNVKGDGEA